MSTGTKLIIASRHGTGVPLTSMETAAVARALDVLRRVAENDCTNPRQEAADILRQIDG